MGDHAVVKILTSKMCVTSSWLHLKDTIFYGQNGHIKGSSTKIKDEDITLHTNLDRRYVCYFHKLQLYNKMWINKKKKKKAGKLLNTHIFYKHLR